MSPRILVWVLLPWVLGGIAAAQTTWYVDDDNCPGGSGAPNDPFCRVQDGINAAADGDTVQVEPGTYAERIDFLGKAIVVQSSQGAPVTILDGSGTGPIVSFVNVEGPGSVLEGFTIRNGYDDYGGGIVCRAAPVIQDNVITGCQAQFAAGGIDCVGAAQILRNTITNCGSAYSTGGVYASGATVVGNLIQGNGGGYGNAGITVTKGVLRGNRILSNWIYDGYVAGVECDNGSLVEDNWIEGNTHQDSEVGGLLCTGNCTIRRNVIVDNQGGMMLWGDATVENTVIADNWAEGGVIVAYGSPTLNHVTITGNGRVQGAGIHCDDGADLLVVDSILWGDQGSKGREVWVGSSYRPSKVTILCTDLDGGAASCEVDPTCTLVLGPDLIDADPRFVDPGNRDLHLARGSPCVNRGAGVLGVLDDLDGDARPAMGSVDLGADEYTGTHDLAADRFTLPVATGGVVNLALDAPAAHAGRTYGVFVSVIGTNPGTRLPGGAAVLPLDLDATSLWLLKLALRGTPGLAGFVGTLDAAGQAVAQFDSLGPLPPAAVGLELAFAFALPQPWDTVSNPVRVVLQ